MIIALGCHMTKHAQPDTRGWLTWITSKSRREVVAFLGGGAVVVIGAARTLFLYLTKPNVKMEVTYNVCFALSKEDCPPDYIWAKGYFPMAQLVGAGTAVVSDWVKKQCAQYSKSENSMSPGPMAECGCIRVTVKCSNA